MAARFAIPKDPIKNMQARINLRKLAEENPSFRNEIISGCRQDVLLFFNLFCYLFEPRPRKVNGKKLPNVIPFITWPHQDKAIVEIKNSLGFEDIGVNKSRGEGMSWIGVLLALHDWLFEERSTIGFVSKNLESADSPDDPDSLMWKVTWELAQLPAWMVGVEGVDWFRNRAKHTLLNHRNHSTIAAYAAVGDVASGGRKKWFLMDELAKFPRGDDEDAMASTQFVTDSRLVVSTPKGSSGAYYELMHEESSITKIVVDWHDNPTRNIGLYTLVDGVPVAIDPVNNPLPANYNPPSPEIVLRFDRLRRKGYALEKGIRSPWYDYQCDRPRATPERIAQELDRDFGGSQDRYFSDEFLQVVDKSLMHPLNKGDFSVNPNDWRTHFEPTDNGQFLLWCPLDSQGHPPRRTYAMGIDVATGEGGRYCSNSVIQIIDCSTGEQVLEFATKRKGADELVVIAVGLAKWFNNAYLAWEHAGPGTAFTSRLLETGYGNIYKRKDKWAGTGNKESKAYGWVGSGRGDARETLFSDTRAMIREGDVVVHSKELKIEFGQYIRDENDKISHLQPDASNAAHGDRVIAFGVAVQAMKDRPIPKEDKAKTSEWSGLSEPPAGTIAHLLWANKRAASNTNLWDQRTAADMAGNHDSLVGSFM